MAFEHKEFKPSATQTLKLPDISPDLLVDNKEAKKPSPNEVHVKIKWTELASPWLGQLIEYNGKDFLIAFNPQTKQLYRLNFKSGESIINCFMWPNNCFALLSKDNLKVCEFSNNQIKEKYLVQRKWTESLFTMNCSIKPFPDGQHFLFLRDANDITLIDAATGKRQRINIPNLYNTYRLLVLPNQIVAPTCRPDLIQTLWIDRTEIDFEHANKIKWTVDKNLLPLSEAYEFYVSASPFFAAACGHPERQVSLWRYNQKEMTFECHNTIKLSDNTAFYFKLSPQGLLVYADKDKMLCVYNPYLRNDSPLGIPYTGEVMFLDDSSLVVVDQSNKCLHIHHFEKELKFVFTAKAELSEQLPNELTDLVLQYVSPLLDKIDERISQYEEFKKTAASKLWTTPHEADLKALRMLKKELNNATVNTSIQAMIENVKNQHRDLSLSMLNFLKELDNEINDVSPFDIPGPSKPDHKP